MVLKPPRLSLRRGQLLAGGWLLLLVLAAVLSSAGQDSALRLDLLHLSQPPSAAHWLGTDPFGRDVLADLLAGTRNLLLISGPGALLASAAGGVLGAAAGYWGNTGLRVRRGIPWALVLGCSGALLTVPAAAPWWALATGVAVCALAWAPLPAGSIALPIERMVLGATAFLGSVPRLVLVLLLAAVHEPSRSWLFVVLGLVCWPGTANLTRLLVQQLRHQSFVEAGYAAGYTAQRLLLRHIFPNAWSTLRAVLPQNLSICLGLQTTLAFLGIGLSPDQSDWGRTLANARLEPGAWWMIISSLLVLTCTVIALQQLLPSASHNQSSR